MDRYAIIEASTDFRNLSTCANQRSTMTVGKLIECLEGLDPNVPVFCRRKIAGKRSYSEIGVSYIHMGNPWEDLA